MNLQTARQSVEQEEMGGGVGDRSRAATIRRKEKNRRDKYKRQFTEPRLWEKTSVSFYFLLSSITALCADGKW